jgi:hypothetical protein
MNKIVVLIVFAILALFNDNVSIAAEEKKIEVKKVCVDKITKDGKTVLDKAGKSVKECKKMKMHKKLKNTEVPPAKK